MRSARERVLRAADLSLLDYLNEHGRERLDEEAKKIIRIAITEEEVDLASFIASINKRNQAPTASPQANSILVEGSSTPHIPDSEVIRQAASPNAEEKDVRDLPDLDFSTVSSPSAEKVLTGEKDEWGQAIFVDVIPGTDEKKVFKKSKTKKYGIERVNIYNKSTITDIKDTALDVKPVSNNQTTEPEATHNANEPIQHGVASEQPLANAVPKVAQIKNEERKGADSVKAEVQSWSQGCGGKKMEELQATRDVVETGEVPQEKSQWATPEWYRKLEGGPSEGEAEFDLEELIEQEGLCDDGNKFDKFSAHQ